MHSFECGRNRFLRWIVNINHTCWGENNRGVQWHWNVWIRWTRTHRFQYIHIGFDWRSCPRIFRMIARLPTPPGGNISFDSPSTSLRRASPHISALNSLPTAILSLLFSIWASAAGAIRMQTQIYWCAPNAIQSPLRLPTAVTSSQHNARQCLRFRYVFHPYRLQRRDIWLTAVLALCPTRAVTESVRTRNEQAVLIIVNELRATQQWMRHLWCAKYRRRRVERTIPVRQRT